MRNSHLYTVLLALLVMLTTGCDNKQDLPTKTTTNVTVKSSVSAQDFDMEAVVARLKKGDLNGPKELEDFINSTPNINNIDIDKNNKVDGVNVTEERGEDGGIVMAVKAYPETGEPVLVAEIGFTKNIETGSVEISGAYPPHVSGYQNHYYRSTLTGSVIGDMMFYNMMFSPTRRLYVSPYHGGYYGGVAPRARMSQSQVTKSRTTYRTQNKVSPVKKASRPSSYKPKSSAAKTAAKKRASSKQARAKSAKLGDRKGTTRQFKDRGTKAKPKARSFGGNSKSKSSSRKPAARKSSPRRSSFGSSRNSGRSRSSGRRSSVIYKHDIEYMTPDEVNATAQQLYAMPLATWQYNESLPEGDGRERMGIIVEDVASANPHIIESNGDHVDLYGYTSMAIAAAQSQHAELEALRLRVENLSQGICQ